MWLTLPADRLRPPIIFLHALLSVYVNFHRCIRQGKAGTHTLRKLVLIVLVGEHLCSRPWDVNQHGMSTVGWAVEIASGGSSMDNEKNCQTQTLAEYDHH